MSVVPWTTEVFTDNERLEFDFGEVAWDTATTSKEGSRCENYSMTHRRSSDEKYQNWALWGQCLGWLQFKNLK